MTFAGITLFGCITWITAGLCVFMFPAADSLAAGSSFSAAIWLIPVIGTASYIPWLLPLAIKDHRPRVLLFSVPFSLLVQLVITAAGSIIVHRDYITLAFQTICIHYILFVYITPHFLSRFFFRHGELLYSFTKAIIFFFLMWILLMGYAIVVRVEPRWIPSIAYNIINLCLCFFLYVTNLGLHTRTTRELLVTPSHLILDHLDITSLFNPSVMPIVYSLLLGKGEFHFTCRDGQKILGKKSDVCDCSKATLCDRYKYLYNRIHEVKRVFSALRLGVILDPPKRRDILTDGWIFRLDSSVTIIRVDEPQ